MKYLVIARKFNEPDNNTPSDEIWCKVVECEPDEVARYESIFANDFMGEDGDEVSVKMIPIKQLQDEWEQVEVIW